MVVGNGFEGDADDFMLDESFGLLRVGRQVHVSEDDLAFAQEWVLFCLNFFDFDDHLRFVDLFGSGYDLSAGFFVCSVVEADGVTGIALDPNFMSLADKGADGKWG